MPKLRVLDLSVSRAPSLDASSRGWHTPPPFLVTLPLLATLLLSLPPSVEVLRLRGWAVAMEPCAGQTNAEASSRVSTLAHDTAEQLRATLRARAAVIAASMRGVSALLPLLSLRLPALRELAWVDTSFGRGTLPSVITSAPSAAAAVRACLHAGLVSMRCLAKLSLCVAVDDAAAAVLSSATPSIRRLCIAVGPGFTNAGCASLASMGGLRVLRLEASASESGRPSVTAAGVAALLRPREGAPCLLRALCVDVACAGAEEAAAAHVSRRENALDAVHVSGGGGGGYASRFVRRAGATGLAACGAPEFEAA